MKKQDFQLGDVVFHKLDDRRLVVISFEYPQGPMKLVSTNKRDVNQRLKEIKKFNEEKKPISVTCRMRDMHGGFTSYKFIPDELRKKAEKD